MSELIYVHSSFGCVQVAGIGQVWLAKLGSVTPVPVGFPEGKRPNLPWENTTGIIVDGDNKKAGKRLFALKVLL